MQHRARVGVAVAIVSAFATIAAARVARAQASRASARGCSGALGGSLGVSERVSGAYSVSFDDRGSHLDGAVLLRGEPGWDHGSGRRTEPLPAQVPHEAGEKNPIPGGGSVDTFAVIVDRANAVAWIGGRRVPLNGANVVLFDRADGVGGAPVVVALLSLDVGLLGKAGECLPDSHEVSIHLRDALLGDSEVRAFVGGKDARSPESTVQHR